MKKWCWAIFWYVCWPSVCILWRNVCLDLLPIFWWGCLLFMLSSIKYLYILEINLISCFTCNYFLPFWGLSFHFVYGFFCCVKAFKSHLFIFVFIFFTLGGRLKKILLRFILESFLPVLSSNLAFLKAFIHPLLLLSK